MQTVFFIVCKIYFRLVLSQRWIRREYYFESRNCDVHWRSIKNVIRNPYCDLKKYARKTKIQLPLGNFSLSIQQLVPNYFLYPCKSPDFHLLQVFPQFWPNKLFRDQIGQFLRLHISLANMTKLSGGGIWRKELNRILRRFSAMLSSYGTKMSNRNSLCWSSDVVSTVIDESSRTAL